jgi:hypothetical protein
VTRYIQGIAVELATIYSNYKMIDGMAIPHSMVTERGGGGPGGRQGGGRMGISGNQEIEIIEFNKDIDDKLFEKPVMK